MRNLNYELKRLCLANREGSYGTQRERERTLTLIANQLDALGFKKMYARSLRPKHVERLVAVWTNGHEELGWKPVSIGSIKNRLAHVRWWAHVSTHFISPEIYIAFSPWFIHKLSI